MEGGGGGEGGIVGPLGGSKLYGLRGRSKGEKKNVKLSCRLLSWDANIPEAAELDTDPVDD